MKESLSPCSKACTTMQWRSTKGYAHDAGALGRAHKNDKLLKSDQEPSNVMDWSHVKARTF